MCIRTDISYSITSRSRITLHEVNCSSIVHIWILFTKSNKQMQTLFFVCLLPRGLTDQFFYIKKVFGAFWWDSFGSRAL